MSWFMKISVLIIVFFICGEYGRVVLYYFVKFFLSLLCILVYRFQDNFIGLFICIYLFVT